MTHATALFVFLLNQVMVRLTRKKETNKCISMEYPQTQGETETYAGYFY